MSCGGILDWRYGKLEMWRCRETFFYCALRTCHVEKNLAKILVHGEKNDKRKAWLQILNLLKKV